MSIVCQQCVRSQKQNWLKVFVLFLENGRQDNFRCFNCSEKSGDICFWLDGRCTHIYKTGAARLSPKYLYETIYLKLFYICNYEYNICVGDLHEVRDESNLSGLRAERDLEV